MGWFQIGKGRRMESEHKLPEPQKNEDQRWLQKAQSEIKQLGQQLRAWQQRK